MLGVRPRATRLRQPGIGDVAHQRMLELVLGLAAERRGRPRHDEPSLLEPEQRARHRRLSEDAGERLQPEATPDDGRLLQHALVVAGEGVDASGNDAVDGVGKRDRGVVDGCSPSISLPDDHTRVDHLEDDLLEEERIAVGCAHDLAP